MGERIAIAKINHFKGKNLQRWAADIPTFNSLDLGLGEESLSCFLQALELKPYDASESSFFEISC
jgi:hypothetical protein